MSRREEKEKGTDETGKVPISKIEGQARDAGFKVVLSRLHGGPGAQRADGVVTNEFTGLKYREATDSGVGLEEVYPEDQDYEASRTEEALSQTCHGASWTRPWDSFRLFFRWVNVFGARSWTVLLWVVLVFVSLFPKQRCISHRCRLPKSNLQS